MVKRRIGIIALLLCLCICLTPCYVNALSTTNAKEPLSMEKYSSLTISYCSGDINFSNISVSLYKIADISENYEYTLKPSFEKSNLIFNGIQTAGEWNVVRSTLEAYIVANGVAANFDTVTDLEGKAHFDTLKAGVYLAITDSVIRDETIYVFDSALVVLPGINTEGLWQYDVEVNAKCEIIPPADADEEIELRVTKLWKGDSGETVRPESIEVEIFRNSTSYEKIVLSDNNQWTYTWKAKDDGSDWKVVERNIPAGYTMTVEQRETVFVLTNTLNQPETPDVPKTGDTSNVMLWFILMIISGSTLIILGITRKRNRV